MVDVDDLTDVIVLQNDFLVRYQQVVTILAQRDEHRAEELIGDLVAMVEGVEVVANVHLPTPVSHHLDIGDVVAGARFRR
ncbi:hypothetical protein D3C87_2025330 [compost metagenome]